MLAPPADLAERDLRAALARGWGVEATSLTYLPLGFGSHHWEAVDASGARWFVTVDLDRADGAVRTRVGTALGTAARLRAAGHEYVIAPLAARDGSVVAGPGRFVVALYPYVDGERFDFGAYKSDEHRRGVVDLLVRLHGADPALAIEATVDDFAIPDRSELELGLVDPGWPDTGPYAAPAAALLADCAEGISAALAAYDVMVERVRRRPLRMAITHGEPHAGNTMHVDGGWVLIDWDTALLAPAERDLWSVDPGDGSVFDAYAAATGVTPDRERLDLYRVRWDLADLAVYVGGFRAAARRRRQRREGVVGD